MKYSYNWIQHHIKDTLPKPEALKERIIFGAFEVEEIEVKGDDYIFDIKVLPDRAGDCLSHYGMAREIAGLLHLEMKVDTIEPLPAIELLLPIEVNTDSCRRYISIRIDGVTVGPSPLWLVERLESVGQRSINNIVDATNYILFDLGQPTHAYDAAKIDGSIIVRPAHDTESIITLSEETKTLSPEMIVIADYLGAIAIAGVKGGKTAEIDATTSSIILEIGNFDPVSVRKTARALSLATDAAKRFENNLSPFIAAEAAAQLAQLIKEVAGGQITGVNDYNPILSAPRTISFAVGDIAGVLGIGITGSTIKEVFDQYHYQYTLLNDVFTLTVPTYRLDITGPHDIAEDIGRAIGYDTIEATPLPTVFTVHHSEIYRSIIACKAWLVHDGYREVMTYSFRSKGEVEIARGPKGKSALRTNLSDALKESYDMNRLNAPLIGLSEIKLFEIGTVFFADREEVRVATVDKGMVKETTLEAYIKEHAIVVDNTSLQCESIPQVFSPWSVYPFSTRDIAVWVADEEGKVVLESIVKKFAATYCVRPAVLFDQFTKDNKTSIAYRFVFQAFDRTLTEAEVGEWFEILSSQILAEKVFTIR
jgi:phenylalanyl-tRNA synthetase beta subunit